MSKVYQLKQVLVIPAPIQPVWDFFSKATNLLTITPPELNLKVTSETMADETYAGQIITYYVKPLLGIPIYWMTEIKHVERLRFFVDEQRRGPFQLWHHQHHFREVADGVEMTDLVHYQIPFFFLGSIAHGLFVRKKVEAIFDYRNEKVREQFGFLPTGGESPQNPAKGQFYKNLLF